MCISEPCSPTQPLEIHVVPVTQYSLNDQNGHGQDTKNLMDGGEGIVLDIHNTEGDGNGEADDADGCRNDLHHPVESDRVKVPEQTDADGEEDDEGATKANRM